MSLLFIKMIKNLITVSKHLFFDLKIYFFKNHRKMYDRIFIMVLSSRILIIILQSIDSTKIFSIFIFLFLEMCNDTNLFLQINHYAKC